MRLSTALTTILLPYSALGTAVHLADLLAFNTACTGLSVATPGSVPHAVAPVPTQPPNRRVLENLDLRQVPPVAAAPNANPAAPNANPVANPNAVPNQAAPNANPAAPAAPGNPALNPAVAPIQPVAPVNPAVPPANGAVPVSVTVQWAETWIGGSIQTWVPQTITFDGSGYATQAPSPGIGHIGMGTLKGDFGVTRTVVLGAAPTVGAPWVVAAAGVVGAVGML